MKVHLLFFASYRDIAGESAMDIDLPDASTVSDCAAALKKRYPRFVDVLPKGRVAVNLEIVDESHQLHDGDEVAFMPPMSGG